MNIIKLTVGLRDTTDGLQGCAVLARPIIAELHAHKVQLEEEKAGPVKKWGLLLGFAALNILDKWKDIREDVLEVKDGVVEIIQAIKEASPTDEEFKQAKDAIDAKEKAKCEALNKPDKGKGRQQEQSGQA